MTSPAAATTDEGGTTGTADPAVRLIPAVDHEVTG
jgi:hypothetical protein